MSLVFDENTLLSGNIFKYESRLKSSLNKYVENGAILTTYFSVNENSSTVDRGIQDVENLFGKYGALRYNQIDGFPLYGFAQATPENTDEQQIEDINIDGECTILPCTVVPRPYDMFILQHLKAVHMFMVTNVSYDSMKPEGYYKIRYHLQTTSHETIQAMLQYQVVDHYTFNLNAVGTDLNPLVKTEDAATKSQVEKMVNQMVTSYRAMFYNERHNCFLYHDPDTGLDWFDMCGNEFMARHSLMNYPNSNQVIVLHEKLNDVQFPIRYNNSVYSWLEMGAPARLLQKFYFLFATSAAYPDSSFYRWGDMDVQIIHPLGVDEVQRYSCDYSFFNETQFRAFMDPNIEPLNEYERLIWKFIHKQNVTFNDISLYTADALISSINHRDIYLYTPVVIYIMRRILGFN